MSDDVPHDERCDGAVDVPYELDGGAAGMTLIGYRCGECGFQTVTRETYVPTEMPCGECGQPFLGMPDVPGERCTTCFGRALDAWLERVKTCQHEPATGLCAKCGTR